MNHLTQLIWTSQSSFPEIGFRVSLLVVVLFLLGFLAVLLYLKIKERDGEG